MADYRSRGKVHGKRTGKTKVRRLPGMKVQVGVKKPAPGTTGIMAIPPAGGSYTKDHITGETIVEKTPALEPDRT